MKSRKTNSNAVSGATEKRSSKIAPPVNRKRPGVATRLLARKRTADSFPALYRERAGVSLLLGLGIVFIMVFFSLLVSNVVVSSIRQSANVSRSNEAYYAAEGALEQGLLENFKKGAGYTSGNESVDYTGNVSGTFQIQGTVPEELKYGDKSAFAGMYGVPTPGTGNAGANCDVKKPVINQFFTYSTTLGYKFFDSPTSGAYDASEYPCNWNKIKTGETVTIPLYYEDENGDFVNLFSGQSQGLALRVRTPCTGTTTPEFCAPTQRFILDFDDLGRNPKPGPWDQPIISWQIEGTDSVTKEKMVMAPNIYYDNFNEIFRPLSSIISERMIYDKRSLSDLKLRYAVLSFSKQQIVNFENLGKDINNNIGCIWQFFSQQASGTSPCASINPWANKQIEKPILKISVIGNLIQRVSGNTMPPVPYLEYQIITSSNLGGDSGPTNTTQTITAEGVSGTFKQVLQVNQPQAGGLPDYVVQQ